MNTLLPEALFIFLLVLINIVGMLGLLHELGNLRDKINKILDKLEIKWDLK